MPSNGHKVHLTIDESASAERRATVIEALKRSKVDLVIGQRGTELRIGILLFGRTSPQLSERLRQLSDNGRTRLLALAEHSGAISGRNTWELLAAGAADVLVWDDAAGPSRVAARVRRWTEIDDVVDSPLVRNNLVGRSPAWLATLRQLVEVAYCTDEAVLLVGESGTGKELAAKLIHTLDRRGNKGELVVLDCTTVVPELSGSELFGHERGAFTGAIATRDGAFALADGGSLFLDEVGDLPATMQAELLRVIQEKTYKRVGSNVWKRTSFRLICATNRDLRVEQAAGRFRSDLYHRLATWVCVLPPLRERTEDVAALTDHFARQKAGAEETIAFEPTVRDFLAGRAYPGNVRELQQLVARMVARHVGPGPITVGDIPPSDRPVPTAPPAHWRDDGFDRAIQQAVARGATYENLVAAARTAAAVGLLREDDDTQRAADRLGVRRRTLQLWLKEMRDKIEPSGQDALSGDGRH